MLLPLLRVIRNNRHTSDGLRVLLAIGVNSFLGGEVRIDFHFYSTAYKSIEVKECTGSMKQFNNSNTNFVHKVN